MQAGIYRGVVVLQIPFDEVHALQPYLEFTSLLWKRDWNAPSLWKNFCWGVLRLSGVRGVLRANTGCFVSSAVIPGLFIGVPSSVLERLDIPPVEHLPGYVQYLRKRITTVEFSERGMEVYRELLNGMRTPIPYTGAAKEHLDALGLEACHSMFQAPPDLTRIRQDALRLLSAIWKSRGVTASEAARSQFRYIFHD